MGGMNWIHAYAENNDSHLRAMIAPLGTAAA
jgi:hypothetical protein